MIINTEQGSIEVKGGITEFKTGIDPKNLEFITTLLSSNLYSAPEQSFIREIVSNAWDSHVEAGNTDTPVIVKFDTEARSITIRDFGTGLSPERFAEVYCNIGSSTKRESNDFIGGFGIGKYSSLAVSNTVYINSYHKGVAYYYIMVKSGNSITTNLVAELPTKEKDGVEVTVKDVTAWHAFRRALDYIVFFPNVYIEGVEHNLNNIKIKKFKYFWCASSSIDHKILLGNVLYPLNDSLLKKRDAEVRAILNKVRYTGIVFKFDIGELSVTPNRENIIYTPEVIDKIADRILEADKEIKEYIANKVEGDYTDVLDYYKAINTAQCYDPMTDSLTERGGYVFNISDLPDAKVTYKGKTVDSYNFKRILDYLQYAELPHLRGVVTNDKVYTTKYPYFCNRIKNYTRKPVTAISKDARLTGIVRTWLKERYTDRPIVSLISYDDYITWLKDTIKHLQLNFESEEVKFVIKELWEEYDNRLEVLDINSDSDFHEYKQAIKDSRGKTPTIKNVILYVYRKPYPECTYQRKYVENFREFKDAVAYIKKLDTGVVFDSILSATENNFFADLAVARGYVYITGAKSVLAALNEMDFTCRVDKSVITKTDKQLRRVSTVLKRGVTFNSLVLDTLPFPVRVEYLWLDNLVQKYTRWRSYSSHACSNTIEEDKWVAKLCDKYQEYSAKWKDAHELVGGQYTNNNKAMLARVLLNRKAYRVSEEYYSLMKNNQLIQELCKK